MTSLNTQETLGVKLNEDQAKTEAMVQALRQKISKDPKLNFRTDDNFLLRFLRAKKFSLDGAFQLMMNYYKQRDKYPQFYRKSLSDLESSLSSNYQGALLKRDCDGRAIYIYNSASHWNTSLFSLEDIAANSVLSFERLIEDEDVQINGMVVLVDTKGLNYKHLLHVNPLTMKRTVDALIHTFPIRYKEIHFINEPYIFDAIFMMLKPFLGKKLLSRIKFHGGNLGNLHDFIKPDIIPEEFGGHCGPFNNGPWNDMLKMHENTIEQNLKFGLLQEK